MNARADHPATHSAAHPPAHPRPDVVETEPPLLDLIRQGQARHDFFPKAASNGPNAHSLPVIVGVSGGADSLCLLHLLVRLAPEFGLAIHVAHLDHGLRPDSATDAAFVADLAAGWGLLFHLKRLAAGQLAGQGGNLEAAARFARFAFLLETAQSLAQTSDGPRWEPVIALAHHADDQAETLLLHLLRGSGLDGLAGMRPVSRRPLPGPAVGAQATSVQYARLVRPLLDAQHTQLVRYLCVHGLTWREDPTNQDPAFTRNRLRHQIMPLLHQINPALPAALGRTARILAGEADRLARLDRETLADLLLAPAQPERLVLDRDRLAALGEADRRGVLRLALDRLLTERGADPEVRLLPTVGLLQIEYDHVAALAEAVTGPAAAGGPFPITAGLAWSVAPPSPGSPDPARLSLHRDDVLPFAPEHPWLAGNADPCGIPVPGAVDVMGWRLDARLCATGDLPAEWAGLSPWEAYLDLDHLGAPALACPKIGLDFSPLGMEGQRKSLGDLFTDHKIPASLRAGWPVILAEDGRVAWVCGVQMGQDFRIAPQTERIVHFVWQPIPFIDSTAKSLLTAEGTEDMQRFAEEKPGFSSRSWRLCGESDLFAVEPFIQRSEAAP